MLIDCNKSFKQPAMKKNLLITIAVVSGMSAFAETPVYPSAWSLYDTNFLADRTLFLIISPRGSVCRFFGDLTLHGTITEICSEE